MLARGPADVVRFVVKYLAMNFGLRSDLRFVWDMV